jgi:2-Cys peroxiredoxin 5
MLRKMASSSLLSPLIKVGSKLPAVTVFEGSPKGAVEIGAVFGQEKGILIGVPGAFTPGCHLTHIPSYIKDFEALKSEGVATIAVVAVNDPFVMSAWGENLHAEGKIRMLADPEAKLVAAMGLDFDGLKAVLGNTRSKRFTAVIEHGAVKHLEVEPDNTGLTCTLAGNIKKHL